MSDFVYLLLNKPVGYVCSTCSDRRHTIYELLKSENCVYNPNGVTDFSGIHPIGRLDAETTGMIILTNDGMFNHNLTIPENHISKTYEVTLESNVDSENQKIYTKKAMEGLLLPPEKKAEEYFAKNAELNWLSENRCSITIHEGKFHQVRRTFLALGNCVTALHRCSIGNLNLPDNLNPGQFCFLSESTLKKAGFPLTL